jgi:hypothetical protein
MFRSSCWENRKNRGIKMNKIKEELVLELNNISSKIQSLEKF